MIKMTKLLPVFIILISPLILYAQPFSVEKNDEGAWVMDNGEKVLFYQAKTKSLNGSFPRANYVHPLLTPGGFEITEDFPKDHLHHRGIFWTWHQVFINDNRIGDGWECRDFIWDVERLSEENSNGNSFSLAAYVLWKSPLWKDESGEMKPFMKEKTIITVHSNHSNYRLIDFDITLLAMEDNLKIGGSEDRKGYGGFSVRMKMPKDIQFVSNGGAVQPKVTQIDAGSWMDISGSMLPGGGKAGILILCHPENPMYPERWILRKSGSMQNPVFPGNELYEISTKKNTNFKYRLVVYDNLLTDQLISQLVEEYR
jgi:hypothetical protein